MAPTTAPGLALLLGSSILAGALNAVSGGGSFLTFPSLLIAGALPVNANATSTVALWPGSGASVAAYRRELGRQEQALVVLLAVGSIAGGYWGAGDARRIDPPGCGASSWRSGS
jgi:uncharacterized membrane protein YfcA